MVTMHDAWLPFINFTSYYTVSFVFHTLLNILNVTFLCQIEHWHIDKIGICPCYIIWWKISSIKIFMLLLSDFSYSEFYKMCFCRVEAKGGQQEKAIK